MIYKGYIYTFIKNLNARDADNWGMTRSLLDIHSMHLVWPFSRFFVDFWLKVIDVKTQGEAKNYISHQRICQIHPAWNWPLYTCGEKDIVKIMWFSTTGVEGALEFNQPPVPNCSVAFCSTCCHFDVQSLPRTLTRRQHWPLLDIFRDTLSQSCSCSDNSPTRQPTAVSLYGLKPLENVGTQSPLVYWLVTVMML